MKNNQEKGVVLVQFRVTLKSLDWSRICLFSYSQTLVEILQWVYISRGCLDYPRKCYLDQIFSHEQFLWTLQSLLYFDGKHRLYPSESASRRARTAPGNNQRYTSHGMVSTPSTPHLHEDFECIPSTLPLDWYHHNERSSRDFLVLRQVSQTPTKQIFKKRLSHIEQRYKCRKSVPQSSYSSISHVRHVNIH